MSVMTVTCENCGGVMKYDAESGMLKCDSCGLQRPVDDGGKKVEERRLEDYAAREGQEEPFLEVETYRCASCGAEVSFSGGETAKLCPMCASPQIAPSRQSSGIPPDGVVPFRIDRYKAQVMFQKWVKTRWFAPNSLKRSYQEGRLYGMYIPFWTFDAKASGRYYGRGGQGHGGNNGPSGIVWTAISGDISLTFDDVAVCATEGEGADMAARVRPFGTTESRPYSPEYLSGYGAQRYRISAPDAFPQARAEMEEQMRQHATNSITSKGYDRTDIDRVSAQFSDVLYKHVLVPVWTASFMYHNKLYNYAINGETGRVVGNRPYSPLKIAIAAMLTALFVLGVTFGGELTGRAEDFAQPQTACTQIIDWGKSNGLVRPGQRHNRVERDQGRRDVLQVAGERNKEGLTACDSGRAESHLLCRR